MTDEAGKFASIINAVKNPLGFLVLVILVLNAWMGVLAIKITAYQGVFVAAIIGSVGFLAVAVIGLSIFRPEALQGVRPWQETYAPRLGDDLFLAIDGAFDNLEPVERDEAWAVLSEVLKNVRKDEKSYRKFCSTVADRIGRHVETKARLANSKAAKESLIKSPASEAGW